MSSSSNNKKECKHKVLSETDWSCTICGMSRYDQFKNNEGRLTETEEKELEYYVNRKHWGLMH
jgi:hypothetical protein